MNCQPQFDHESGTPYVNIDKPNIVFEKYEGNYELSPTYKVVRIVLTMLMVPYIYFMNTSNLPAMIVLVWIFSFLLGMLVYDTYVTNK